MNLLSRGHLCVDVVLLGQHNTVMRRTRSWRSFDVDAFLRDVTESPFLRSHRRTSTNCSLNTSVHYRRYSTNTLRYVFNGLPRAAQSHMVDDRVCRAEKRKTRRLERIYRRRQSESTDARDALATQFQRQRQLFRTTATNYWLTTIANCVRKIGGH